MELDVLAGGEVTPAPAVLVGDVAEHVELLGVDPPVGDLDPHHLVVAALALPVDARCSAGTPGTRPRRCRPRGTGPRPPRSGRARRRRPGPGGGGAVRRRRSWGGAFPGGDARRGRAGRGTRGAGGRGVRRGGRLDELPTARRGIRAGCVPSRCSARPSNESRPEVYGNPLRNASRRVSNSRGGGPPFFRPGAGPGRR